MSPLAKPLGIDPNQLHAHLIMLFWTLLVASSFPASAQFAPELSPTLLVSLRFVTAGLIMLLFIARSTRPSGRYPLAAPIYLILGLLQAGFFALVFASLQDTTPLVLAALSVSQPLIAYLLAALMRIEPFLLRRCGELLIAGGAALIIVSHGKTEQLLSINWGRGETFFMIGCVMAAAYLTLTRWSVDHHLIAPHPYNTTCFSLLAGGIAIALPQTLSGQLPTFINLLQWHDLLWLGYLTLFTTLITFWMFQFATLHLSPSLVSAYGYLPPLIVLLGAVWLGTTPWQSTFWLAIILLCWAMITLARADNRQ